MLVGFQGVHFFVINSDANKRHAVAAQTARCRSEVLSIQCTLIILRAKGSGREDKAFTEKSRN